MNWLETGTAMVIKLCQVMKVDGIQEKEIPGVFQHLERLKIEEESGEKEQMLRRKKIRRIYFKAVLLIYS